MKADELIKLLKKFAPDTEVVVWSDEVKVDEWPVLHVDKDDVSGNVVLAIE